MDSYFNGEEKIIKIEEINCEIENLQKNLIQIYIDIANLMVNLEWINNPNCSEDRLERKARFYLRKGIFQCLEYMKGYRIILKEIEETPLDFIRNRKIKKEVTMDLLRFEREEITVLKNTIKTLSQVKQNNHKNEKIKI